MERGDLAEWVEKRMVVVLEGVLAQIPPPRVDRKGLLGRNKETHWATADQWGWSRMAIKYINDKAYRLSIPIDVVTFLSPEIADEAAEWLDKFGVRVSSCEYAPFDVFCDSLTWRPDIHTVVDSEKDRLHLYGVRAYETQWGGAF